LSNQYARADAIWASDVKRVGYIPSMTVAPVIHELVAIDGGGNGISARVMPLSREEEAAGDMGTVSLVAAWSGDSDRFRTTQLRVI